VQGGAARAHEAADHDGPFDLVLQDPGSIAPHLLGAQSLLERLDHHVARRRAPVLVEASLPVVGLEQDPHALEIGRIAEVVGAHRSTGFFVEDLFGFDEAHCARVSHGGQVKRGDELRSSRPVEALEPIERQSAGGPDANEVSTELAAAREWRAAILWNPQTRHWPAVSDSQTPSLRTGLLVSAVASVLLLLMAEGS
jgi:hypothetical protein